MSPTMTDEETFVTLESCDFADADFVSIEAAVMETARGRWFLREYARRNRHADTEVVLEAVNRLRDNTLPGRALRVMDHLHGDLSILAVQFEEVRREVGLLPPADRLGLSPMHPDLPLSEADEAGIERIRGILKTLRHLEARVQAMLAICDPAPVEADPIPPRQHVPQQQPFLM